MTAVIIEGPDGAGKTTLIKTLRRLTPFVTVALGGPVQSHTQMDAAIELFREIHDSSDLRLPVVFDRHPSVSEHIYSRLLGRKLFLSFAELPPTTAALVYCRPSIEQMRLNLREHQQLEGVVDNFDRLVELYDSFMNWVPHTKYNYLIDPIEPLVKLLKGIK